MPLVKWTDHFYVTCYELARGGMTEPKIAQAIGVSAATLAKWKERRPALRDALRRGRKGRDRYDAESFHEYIYNQLPQGLQRSWDNIAAAHDEQNVIKKMELLEAEPKKARQHLFLYAVTHTNFNVSRAMQMCGLSRKTYEHWLRHDPDFAELVQELQWHKKNFFESALIALVASGDSSATIFANKTANKDRGYNEKVDVQHTHSHTHKHTHAVITIGDLNLDLETRKTLLAAVRQRKLEIGTNDNSHAVEEARQRNLIEGVVLDSQ